MLQRLSLYWSENGHITEVANLMEGEWSCYRGSQSNGGETGHVTDVVSLMDGEWSCKRGGQFNGGRMIMLRRLSL